MGELLPTIQAEAIRNSLTDYLTTTFALTDAGARSALDDFLSHPESGMFKGPFIRLRLPFRSADTTATDVLEWDPSAGKGAGWRPYGHQAAAFARLSSQVAGKDRRPLSTLVTTGTGSGKTEAFLYPIIDHVLRARRQGVTGVKALILYPMNALANDQAGRLAQLITGRPELAAVTAGLYTGQDQVKRTKVTVEGLITDRYAMRDNPPDILLTNYKMLDQLLLRADDQGMWKASAASLTYLVLDEFHTYDGAQGTDVAMLLRRLGLALKHFAPDGFLTEEDQHRPLGRVTPVATSATLGGEDSGEILRFATTVFGEPFEADAIIGESRYGLSEWVGDARDRLTVLGVTPLENHQIRVSALAQALRELGDSPEAEQVTGLVLSHLFRPESEFREATMVEAMVGLADHVLKRAEDREVALKAHPLVQKLVELTAGAQRLDSLPGLVLDASFTPALAATGWDADWEAALDAVVAVLGHVRAAIGRSAVSVEVHYWLRELTRIDRVADTAAAFRWSDDGPMTAWEATEESRPAFPAIYCRRCGRSGWSIKLAPVGDDLAGDDSSIRREQMQKSNRIRPLIHAPGEADTAVQTGVNIEGLRWLSVKNRMILDVRPAEDDPDFVAGWVLPVLTHVGMEAGDASQKETCPSCGQVDGIRFLGSAVATLLSVSLSTLFGSPTLDSMEKRALVFTDSVQDAAHRAGFVQARAHTMTLRSILREALEDGELTLDTLVQEVIDQAGDNKTNRYRLLPPDCADRESFTPFWERATLRAVPAGVRKRVNRRLQFDATLEFGLNSRLGRTLELTGSVCAEVQAGSSSRMAVLAREAIDAAGWQDMLSDISGSQITDSQLTMWVRGVLDRIRSQGGIAHAWLEKYILEDGNRFQIWGGRRKDEGMPAFPIGRPAPAFPRVGAMGSAAPKKTELDPVASPKSWYSLWSAKVLGIQASDAGRIVPHLLKRLADAEVLQVSVSKSNARVYAIPPSNLILRTIRDDDLLNGAHMLECSTCRALTPGSIDTITQLVGAPCFSVRCQGHLEVKPVEEGFYRRLYQSFDMRRIVAREHTGLLDDKTRLAYENGFKKAGTDPQSPNVLVATPTLEMGIDIGDLSAVFLASLPKTVAAYTQRVGRAGRLTGNALAMVYVTGRGGHLQKLADPLSMIDGEIRTPATYLAAEEILRRQYTAALVDCFARDASRPHPKKVAGALGRSEKGSFLGDLIEFGEQRGPEFDRFVEAFSQINPEALLMLRRWLEPTSGAKTSQFAAHLIQASQAWHKLVDVLRFRADTVEGLIPDLDMRASSPAATEDDKQTLHSAQAALRLAKGRLAHLRSEYWISVLEEYALLPNYTLLDETATLDVGLSWTDPETGQFETDHLEFQRSATLALREFAPGAEFYARGLQIKVDAVDLGSDAEAIHSWALCPACGFAQQLDEDNQSSMVTVCPRCGESGIADTGSQLEIVELAHSTAEIRRDESTISDRDDERQTRRFEIVTAVDLDPANATFSWADKISGFASSYYQALTVRWINLGQSSHGSSMTIAGDTRPAKLFRVCEGCGKEDNDAGLNSPYEHRAWCPFRTQFEEQTRSVALSHTLHTQGLVLRLPNQITLADPFSLPSLAAALQLGLREQIGGDPDHLSIISIKAPTPTGDGTSDALLLHDLVPGGTGYLTDWAASQKMFELLSKAWRIVKDCPCQDEDRLCCDKCLLPYTPSGKISFVSRASAERHLADLLRIDADHPEPDLSRWELTTDIAEGWRNDAESVLEQRFRQVLRERLVAMGATVKETPGTLGNSASITLPGTARRWTLRPQVLVGATRPDFVFESNDPSVPWVAIYTDGWQFHASQAHNRLADDAEKRADLRDQNYVVLAVTSADVDAAQQSKSEEPIIPAEMVSQAQTQPALQATPKAYQLLGINPIDWLLAWVQQPDYESLRKASRAVPLAFSNATQTAAAGKGESLAAIATRALHGTSKPTTTDATRQVMVYQAGRLAAGIEMDDTGSFAIALVLDDAAETLNHSDQESWREWLRLSNAMALRDWPTVITTTTLIESGADTQVKTVAALSNVDLSDEWADLVAKAQSSREAEILALLAKAGISTPPILGEEGPDGIPLDMSWPALKIVVEMEPIPEEDLMDLEAAGWTVLDAEIEELLNELTLAGVN